MDGRVRLDLCSVRMEFISDLSLNGPLFAENQSRFSVLIEVVLSAESLRRFLLRSSPVF